MNLKDKFGYRIIYPDLEFSVVTEIICMELDG